MFICQINSNTSSTILSWRSEEYIHEQLTFTVFNTPGMIMMDPMFMDTVATYNATGTSLLVLKPRADAPNASNIDVNHIKYYFVQFPSGYQNISNTGAGNIIVVPDCTQDVCLNVSAVNICGTVGASISDIEPMFIPTTATTTGSESSLTLASTIATTDRSTIETSTICWHCFGHNRWFCYAGIMLA